MSFAELTLKEFTDVLASKSAVPGGGGACALTAALGSALGSMVGALTVGKKKYADVEQDVKKLMERAEELRAELLALADEDAAVFEPLSRAYGIPKDDPDRDRIMEACLKDACSVPLKIMRLACETIKLQEGFARMGSVLAVSDAGTGVAFARAALYGGALNVRVNTRLMQDRAYADNIDHECDVMLAEFGKMADSIYVSVFERLK